MPTEEKPWLFPAPGDVLVHPDGRQWRLLLTDTLGGHVEGVQYSILDSLLRVRWVTCLGDTWRRNASRAVGHGGSYLRAQGPPGS